VIVPREIERLHAHGIDRIFSPEDGRRMGLQGMIDLVLEGCDFALEASVEGAGWLPLARRITLAELGIARPSGEAPRVPVIGLTGTGGAG
jgi:methylmalonyl-CoA mutase